MKKRILLMGTVAIIGLNVIACSSEETGKVSTAPKATSTAPAADSSIEPSQATGGETSEPEATEGESTRKLYGYREVDGGIDIDEYMGEEEVVAIPSEIDGKTVVSISGWRNDTAKEIIIPDTVKKIDKGAFKTCYSLEKVTFGKGIEEIREDAFFLCESLVEIRFVDGVKKISTAAFPSTKADVYIPGNVEEIQFGAFGSETTIHAPSGSVAEAFAEKPFDGGDKKLTFVPTN